MYERRNDFINCVDFNVDRRNSQLAAQPQLGLWPEWWFRFGGSDHTGIGINGSAVIFFGGKRTMFRQSFFNRYPRLVLSLITIMTLGIISLGILALSAGYLG